MSKQPSPLLGYNNNVRHKGRVFHIQTEDSGVKYGHIITHLFMDGGRILKSVKTGYSEYIGNERMGEIVREMMKQQHKAMFIALRDGKFDSVAEGAAAHAQASAAQAPKAPAAEPPPDQPQKKPAGAPPTLRAMSAASAPRITEAAPKATPTARPSLPEALTARYGSIHDIEVAPPVEGAPATIRQNVPREDLSIDAEALEHVAAAAGLASPTIRTSDLPPPPANLLREKTTTGKYRVAAPLEPLPAATSTRPSPPPEVSPDGTSTRPGPSSGSRRPSQGPPVGERRYAPTRPASIFGQAKPQRGKSIFGEDLISDKSLDEVILSYLAEDLDDKK